MYKSNEEITNEVVFTRLLRAMDCYSDEEVFDMVEDTEYESEDLKYPEDSSADYIRYCEIENLMGDVFEIEDSLFKLVDEYKVFDKNSNQTVDVSEDPLFNDKAICICSNYDLDSVTEYMHYGEDIEIWMTDKYDFYSVSCFYVETGDALVHHRRILSCASKDRVIKTSLFNFLYGLQEAKNQKYD